MIFTKNCPICNKKIFYLGKNAERTLKLSIQTNSNCTKCAGKIRGKNNKGSKNPMFGKPAYNKNVPMSQEQKDKISKTRKKNNIAKGSKNPMFGIKLTGSQNGMHGKKHTEETKQLMREKALIRVVSEETKRKNRESKLNLVKERGWLKINPTACKFIDNLNKLLGINLQHDKNGGEFVFCGYSVDGYDKEKNIIFEYDEKHHTSPKFKNRDIIRQKIIINEVKPNLFIRYDEKNKKLYDAETFSEIFIL